MTFRFSLFTLPPMKYTLSKIYGREVLDSRGNPTVEVEVTLNDGSFGRAIVPSGASTGKHEALELRDGDKSRYLGKGVLKAVSNINEVVSKTITGQGFVSVYDLDKKMNEIDGTAQKSNLGANAILGVSLAFSHAVAASQKRPLFLLINEWMNLSEKDLCLPTPLMNIINGGMHADNGLAIQEFMIVPHGFENFRDALRAGVEVFHHLKKKLHDGHLSTAVGDEGGFAPALESDEKALAVILEAVKSAGYEPGKQISLALDCAASSFYNEENGKYKLSYKGNSEITKETLMEFYSSLTEKYPLVSIEDGLEESDWSGWKTFTDKFSKRLQLVGDDLFVTQSAFLQKGITEKVANSILIKVNQVGSFSETFDTMKLATSNNYRSISSHRSGETEDATIAHLAVGSGCGQIKTGSASRSDRMAKYNELLRIDDWARQNKKNIRFMNAFAK